MSKTAGCFTIVVNDEGYILLAKRRDYPLWDLPGGRLEKDEPLETCAIRETEEETGYKITIQRKIGEYYQPQYNDTQHLFLGELIGGKPLLDGPETRKVEWFKPSKLPWLMIPNRRKQINNYLLNKNTIMKDSLTVSPLKILLLKGFFKAFSKLL